MNTPDSAEFHLIRILVRQLIHALACARLAFLGIVGSNPSLSAQSGLVLRAFSRCFVNNRPATPLNDAQLGGYFFARILPGRRRG